MRGMWHGMTRVLSYAIANLVLVGCGTSQKANPQDDLKEAFRSIGQKYQTQAHDQCLVEIRKLMTKRLPPGAKAELTMVQGLCLEEKGDLAAADEVYRKVVADYPQTRFADRGRRRLERRDGDQKEHLEIPFEGERWQRHRKTTSPAGVRLGYHRLGEGNQGGAVIEILSVDRPAVVMTIEDALTRCESEFVLRGGHVDTVLLERTENDALWEVVLMGNRRAPTTGLLRIILTPQRMHGILGGSRTRWSSAEEKRDWADRLKRATVVGSK